MAWVAYRTWVAGDVLTAAQLNQDVRDNGNIIAAIGITGWTSYTASWTSSGTQPALGNGVLTAYYCQIGKLVVANHSLVLGSTSTVGTGNYSWAIPVTADSQATGSTSDRSAGSGYYRDTGTAVYMAWPILASTTTVIFYYEGGAAAQLSATGPVVPANTDRYAASLNYEAA